MEKEVTKEVIENNKEQPKATSKYFYIEMIASLFITGCIIFGAHHLYMWYLYKYTETKCLAMEGCIGSSISIVNYTFSCISVMILWLISSKIYFKVAFSQSIIKFISSLLLSSIAAAVIFWIMSVYIKDKDYLFLTPFFLSIIIDRLFINKIILIKDTISQKILLKKLFIHTLLLLLTCEILLSFFIAITITQYLFY